MSPLRRPFLLAAVALAVTTSVAGQQRPTQPTTPRLYIFDNGTITGLDPKMFGFSREEVKEPDFVGVSYLIVHPRGTLMFDGRTPSFEWNAEISEASRAKVAAFLKQTGAEMWIEHDKATNDKLPKAPA